MIQPRLLLATRNEHKAREIRRVLGHARHITILTPQDLGLNREPEEDDVERFDTFLENATAKARYFADRAEMPTLADDSGLSVEALGGAPGVRSKRFAADAGISDGRDPNEANNDLLLKRLVGVPDEERTARFVCAAALVSSADAASRCFVGTCAGRITHERKGDEGFGYDPLFLLPDLGYTTAQIHADEKNRRSHRGRAFRAVAAHLARILPALERSANVR